MTGTRHRRATVRLTAAGLVGGALLLAPPASAAIQEGPAADQVLTQHGATRITATHQGPSRLELVNPAGDVVRESTGATLVTEGTLSIVLNSACPAEPADGCAPSAPGANGRWTIRQTGSTEDSRAFFLRIGGTPPTDVTAALAERVVTVTWKQGPEPDVRTFVVSDDSDDSITRTVEADACSDGTCSTTIAYPAPATGERSFSVRALRPSGVEGVADVAGAPARTERVALPAPPADPTGAPTAGATGSPSATPGTPGATGGPAAGGDGQATAQSFGQGFSSFAPSLGLPKVPPLPATTAPQVAGPLVADTFEETLEYGERDPVLPEPIAAPRGRETVLQSTGGLLGDEQLLRSVAGALVLMLAAGHLRTWLARSRPDDLA